MNYNPDSVDHLMTGALYIDQLLANMRTEYPDADDCEECMAEVDE